MFSGMFILPVTKFFPTSQKREDILVVWSINLTSQVV